VLLLTAIITTVLGYLSGSVSYAILIAKHIHGVEIRDVGNENPGTANVVRSIGRGWGSLVGILDCLKALVPIWLAEQFVYTSGSFVETLAIFAVGGAAVAGHCKPLFHEFRGGKGAGPYLGIMVYFVIWESLATTVLATIVVALFVRGVAHRWSRWGPIVSITLCPFVVIAAEALGPFHMGPATLGGKGWGVAIGVFATAMLVLGLNYSFMTDRVVELQDGRKA